QQVYKYQHRKQGDIKIPDYIVDAGFGGPVPVISKMLGDLRFYLSYRQEQDAYLIPLSRDSYDDNVTQLKLTSNITPSIKLTLSGMYGEIHAVNSNNVGLPGYFRGVSGIASQLGQRSYITGIMYGDDYWCPTHIYRHMASAKLTFVRSSKTFYELNLERIGNIYRTRPNALRDTTKIVKIGNNYWLDEAPYGYMPYPSSGIDGLRMGVGMSNSRDYSEIFTTTAKLNLTSQVNESNQIKAGFEFIYNEHNVEYGGIDLTLPSGRPWSIWDKYPLRGAAFITDKLEFRGMIANVGVRMDYVHAGGDWYDIDNEDFWFDRSFFSSSYTTEVEQELEKQPTKHLYYFSPRLGISHPITDNSKLFFNYGHYRSMPEAQRLYTLQRVTEGSVSQIGNPNNTPSRTIAYELGYEHNILNQFLLRLSTYYKNEMFQPNWVRYISADAKVNYIKAHDNYYEDIRGFEITLERLFGRWIYGMVNYTYQVNTSGYFGKLRYYENPAEQRDYDRNIVYQEKPLPRPYFKTNLIFHSPVEFGPKYFGKHLLGDWLMSLRVFWREGAYSTWTRGVSLPGIQYNVQWPDYFNVDMKISKNIKLGNYNLEFFMDINNVFNNKIFSSYCFADGNDYRDYFDSLLWPEDIGKPLGYTMFGNDKIGDLRPENVAYDPLELNPDNDPEIAARNQQRRDSKSYIDNPNLKWLYYLNPRDIYFGIQINF
ncbi:MAG: TonB-dependent receptor, partial [bacterium]|nr:TonB-dependent receptor [bacterium]